MKYSSISVIVPAYNEEKEIGRTVLRIYGFLKERFNAFEIIAIDDGSRDKTYEKAAELSAKVANLKMLRNDKNCGKGYSVRKGARLANSEYIAFTDCDLSTPIEELEKFMPHLERGKDIVIGSRALKASNILKKQGFLRRNMGKIFNLLVKIFLLRGINDTQCGFKCFRNDKAGTLFRLQRLNGFCFDTEILYIAKKRGYAIEQVPIKWINREDSRVSMIKGSLSMFFDIFRIKINDMAGLYAGK